MNWKLSTTQRIRMGLSFVVVFLLILITNLIDKNHFEIVRENLNTVYEDRLVAKNYLYKIHRLVQLKEKLFDETDSTRLVELNASLNDSIQALVGRFSQTRLTQGEADRFTSLQENLEALDSFEKKVFSSESFSIESPGLNGSDTYFTTIYADLDALFEIQLEEGERIVRYSNDKIEASDLIAKLEIGFLIFIGIIIQVVIFLKPIK